MEEPLLTSSPKSDVTKPLLGQDLNRSFNDESESSDEDDEADDVTHDEGKVNERDACDWPGYTDDVSRDTCTNDAQSSKAVARPTPTVQAAWSQGYNTCSDNKNSNNERPHETSTSNDEQRAVGEQWRRCNANCLDIDPHSLALEDSTEFWPFSHDYDPVLDDTPPRRQWLTNQNKTGYAGGGEAAEYDEFLALLYKQRRMDLNSYCPGYGFDMQWDRIPESTASEHSNGVITPGVDGGINDVTTNRLQGENGVAQSSLPKARHKSEGADNIRKYVSKNIAKPKYSSNVSSAATVNAPLEADVPCSDIANLSMKPDVNSCTPAAQVDFKQCSPIVVNQAEVDRFYWNTPNNHKTLQLKDIHVGGSHSSTGCGNRRAKPVNVSDAQNDAIKTLKRLTLDDDEQEPAASVSVSAKSHDAPSNSNSNSRLATDDAQQVPAWSRWRNEAEEILSILPPLMTQIRDVYFAKYARFRIGVG